MIYAKGDRVQVNVPGEQEHGEVGTVDEITPGSYGGPNNVFVLLDRDAIRWRYWPEELTLLNNDKEGD